MELAMRFLLCNQRGEIKWLLKMPVSMMTNVLSVYWSVNKPDPYISHRILFFISYRLQRFSMLTLFSNQTGLLYRHAYLPWQLLARSLCPRVLVRARLLVVLEKPILLGLLSRFLWRGLPSMIPLFSGALVLGKRKQDGILMSIPPSTYVSTVAAHSKGIGKGG